MTTAQQHLEIDKQEAILDQNVPIVKKAVQAKLKVGLNLLLDQVENEVKTMPEAQAIEFSRKDLILFLDDLIYNDLTT